MKRHEIEQSLRRTVGSSASGQLEQIWNRIEREEPGSQISLLQEDPLRREKHTPLRRAAVLLAACLLLLTAVLAGRYVYTDLRVESVVGLDVNPSIELSTNSRNQVVSWKAGNPEGELILGEMNLKKVDLEVAVNAIIGSMFQRGFLKEDSIDNTIVVTVIQSDRDKAANMQQQLLGSINGVLSQNNAEARVICHHDSNSGDLHQLAGQYGISLSKADLIRDIVRLDGTRSPEALARLPVKELAELLEDLEDEAEEDDGQNEKDHHESKGESRPSEESSPHTEHPGNGGQDENEDSDEDYDSGDHNDDDHDDEDDNEADDDRDDAHD